LKLQKPYKIVFFGTPEFAVPTLKALHTSDLFDICLVVSQPDRPSGRKLKLTPSPVKTWAEAQGLPVLTPETCKTDAFLEHFASLNVDGAVVVAFGQILTQKLLNLCPSKFINMHASLLPRWRGAAPIQRAIMSGDTLTGVSAQVMVKRLDAGDVIFEVKTEILAQENSVELHDRLASLAADKCAEGIAEYFKGLLLPATQDESLVTYATKIEKNETWIDWTKTAPEIWNHIRGLALGPGGATQYKNKRLKIIRAIPLVGQTLQDLLQLHSLTMGDLKNPGQVLFAKPDGLFVICGQNSKSVLQIQQVQPESKPAMKVSDFINGSGLKAGDILSNP
jgi:methionyl-tRNA formyltransferase